MGRERKKNGRKLRRNGKNVDRMRKRSSRLYLQAVAVDATIHLLSGACQERSCIAIGTPFAMRCIVALYAAAMEEYGSG